MASSDEEPLSPTLAAGIEFHHVYETNIKAGFSPDQAMYLLAVQMTGSPGPAPGPPLSITDHALLCAHGAVLCALCGFIPDSWKPI